MGKKKKSRVSRRIELQNDFISSEKPQNRIEYEKLIDNRRDEVEEVLIQKSKDFRKFNIAIKESDIKKDRNIISNKSFNQIKNGFLNTSNKEKYIKQNAEHIKALPINNQRNLMSLFLEYL